ncbi:TPA: hypothetical protein ACX6R8_000219 [Photobacterium damselae]|uniref:Uncharacterized protein n=1 Tax=Photobacterium damselae subsp. damselae TaxID=85581 RepID=A0AAD3WZ10_PHODD|nr:hypothetical protein [Photobacterium damselae]KAB1182345.1 hypothetical protein F6450_06420 [Photobacterium damselae subsp. damselae]
MPISTLAKVVNYKKHANFKTRMMLKELLKSKVSRSGVTQSRIVSQLNLYHKEFENLDDITFSRWVNGRTKPSRLKTFLLVLFFSYEDTDERFFLFKKIFHHTKCDKNYIKKLEDKKKLLSDSYHNIKNVDFIRASKLEQEVPIKQMQKYLSTVHLRSSIIYDKIISSIPQNKIKNVFCSIPHKDYNHLNHLPYICYDKVKEKEIILIRDNIWISNTDESTLNLLICLPGYATSMKNYDLMSKSILYSLLQQESQYIMKTKIIAFIRHSITFEFYLMNGFSLQKIIYLDGLRYYIVIANAEDVLSSRYCISLLTEN